jgi:hypothetical protein
VTNAVHFAGSTTDSYSRGAALSNTDIYYIVQAAISAGTLPADDAGTYFVLTSADVTEGPGFCTSWCGWHTYGTMKAPGGKGNKGGSSLVKYAFVGNPDQCPNACEAQTTSPNSNAGADGMASVIAHELSEMVTDPQINAWYDKYGEENADKCAWTFGTTYCATPAAPSKGGNCAKANVLLGSRNYLIQQNWVNVATVDNPTGYCAVSY